ncbi:hypothetical protein ACQP2U_25295 [Nocardia sp. CA-084685]|uniref:hypothetical protein n=1 Tax=Nocardia sp. CA-084685 TaxID=3239970 RepID=UPI003D996306
MEILASAIPLRQLLIGKVIGNTIMAFGQLALFVGAGLIGSTFTGKGDQVSEIAGAAGWFIVFSSSVSWLLRVCGRSPVRSRPAARTSSPPRHRCRC